MNPSIESRRIDPIIIVFAALQIIFIIAIISLLSISLQDDRISDDDLPRRPKISITELSQKVPGLLPGNISAIEQAVFSIIKVNTQSVNTKANAVLREGTIKTQHFDRQNVDYVTALIDIPELEQSYQLFHEYSEVENNEYLTPNGTILVLCLDNYSDKIYPEFNCKDFYNQETRKAITAKYIEFFGFNQFNAYIKDNDLSTVIISPKSFNIDKTVQEEYIQQVKSAVESLGISPEIFQYQVASQSDMTFYNKAP